jgi:hypothetical protein
VNGLHDYRLETMISSAVCMQMKWIMKGHNNSEVTLNLK